MNCVEQSLLKLSLHKFVSNKYKIYLVGSEKLKADKIWQNIKKCTNYRRQHGTLAPWVARPFKNGQQNQAEKKHVWIREQWNHM